MRTLALVSTLVVFGCAPASPQHGGPGGGKGNGTGGVGNGGAGGGGGGSGNGGGGGGGGSGSQCGGMEFALSRVPPNVMLVLDRSQSMTDPIGIGSTTQKYDDLTTAIGALVQGYDGQMRLGATFFASDDNCAPGVPGPILANNGQTIMTEVAAHTPGSNTPTATTLDAVIASHELTDPTRGNYVVLATDGLPNCRDVDVTTRIKKLYASNPPVATFVIGIGADTNTNPDLLNEWADAGHTAKTVANPGDPRYFQTNSPGALKTAFDSISSGIVSCDFKMAQAAPDPTLITVTENGMPVSPSPTVGYTYDPGTNTITLHGAACDTLKSNPGTKVQVIYGCPGLPPIS
jgi:hypothetical protein